MAMNGSLVLIAINTGTTEAPEYEVLPCQKAGEYSLDSDTIDTSCKDTDDATNLPGRRTRTMSVEANPDAWPEIVVSPTTVGDILRKAAETGLQVGVAIVVSGTEVEEGVATITNYTLSYPEQDVMSVSIELAISGAMTPIALDS